MLVLKRNQGTFHEEVTLFLDRSIGDQLPENLHEFQGQPEKNHGRIETRRAWCTAEVDWFEDRDQWPGLRCFAAVECERTVDGKNNH